MKIDYEINGVSLKNFVNLPVKDLDEILTWRNHPLIRKHMIDQEIIGKEQHYKFIEHLKQAEDKSYWMAVWRETPLGVLDIYQLGLNRAFWGYYIKPDLLGKGLGVLLEAVVQDLAFDHLKLDLLSCETLQTNLAVLRGHKTFGFKIKKQVEDLVVMEISKETWIDHQDQYAAYMAFFNRKI